MRKKFLHLMLPSTKLILIVFHFTFAAAEDAVDAAASAAAAATDTIRARTILGQDKEAK